MFARSVSMHLKAGSVAEFTRTINDEAIPLLRKHKGFLDEIVLIVPGGTEAVGIDLEGAAVDVALGKEAAPANRVTLSRGTQAGARSRVVIASRSRSAHPPAA